MASVSLTTAYTRAELAARDDHDERKSTSPSWFSATLAVGLALFVGFLAGAASGGKLVKSSAAVLVAGGEETAGGHAGSAEEAEEGEGEGNAFLELLWVVIIMLVVIMLLYVFEQLVHRAKHSISPALLPVVNRCSRPTPCRPAPPRPGSSVAMTHEPSSCT